MTNVSSKHIGKVKERCFVYADTLCLLSPKAFDTLPP